MEAKSVKVRSAEEIGSALQQCVSDGFDPTLAIVFISMKQGKVSRSFILRPVAG